MEKIVTFGKENNLFGILTEPEFDAVNSDLPIILILNAGLVHRIGPFRTTVDMSRALNSHGYRVFRFDLSGIGDSDKIQKDNLSFNERNLSDVGEAIDCLHDKFLDAKFFALGLCTGADLAHRAAVKYDNIQGAIMLDGYAYPTPKHYLIRFSLYYLKRFKYFVQDISRIQQLFKQRSLSEAIKFTPQGMDEYYWELPEKSDYLSDMKIMFQARKKHFYLYTGGINYYSYKDQYKDSFQDQSFFQDVSVNYLPETDHMFALHEHREQLFTLIISWLKKTQD